MLTFVREGNDALVRFGGIFYETRSDYSHAHSGQYRSPGPCWMLWFGRPNRRTHYRGDDDHRGAYRGRSHRKG